MRRFFLSFLLLFAVSCAGWQAETRDALDTATQTANTLKHAAEQAEGVLTDACKAAELAAVASAKDQPSAILAVGAVRDRCHEAWTLYQSFETTWSELTYSIEAAKATLDAPTVTHARELLDRLVQEEKDFAALVSQVVEMGRK